MVSFYLGLGFSLYYLHQTSFLQRILGGLVVRTGDSRPGPPGSNPARIHEISFFVLIEEPCTLTTFLEQKLSLLFKKLRNFL